MHMHRQKEALNPLGPSKISVIIFFGPAPRLCLNSHCKFPTLVLVMPLALRLLMLLSVFLTRDLNSSDSLRHSAGAGAHAAFISSDAHKNIVIHSDIGKNVEFFASKVIMNGVNVIGLLDATYLCIDALLLCEVGITGCSDFNGGTAAQVSGALSRVRESLRLQRHDPPPQLNARNEGSFVGLDVDGDLVVLTHGNITFEAKDGLFIENLDMLATLAELSSYLYGQAEDLPVSPVCSALAQNIQSAPAASTEAPRRLPPTRMISRPLIAGTNDGNIQLESPGFMAISTSNAYVKVNGILLSEVISDELAIISDIRQAYATQVTKNANTAVNVATTGTLQ